MFDFVLLKKSFFSHQDLREYYIPFYIYNMWGDSVVNNICSLEEDSRS